MGKRIEYQKGQEIGPYHITYVEEAEPVIQSNGKPIRQAYFKCGRCGKIFKARINNIKNGHTRSCGCYSLEQSIKNIKEYNAKGLPVWNKHEYKEGDEVGDYGVKYIKEDGHQGKARKGIFGCPICHTYFSALIDNVSTGKTKGCGNHHSVGEERLRLIFDNLGIKYEYQKSFPDNFSSITHYPYHYDYYLPDYNLCIEYDGIQHFSYKENTAGWNNKENYLQTQHNDKEKNEYCASHNINLLRIPYTDLSILNEQYIQKKLSTYPKKRRY